MHWAEKWNLKIFESVKPGDVPATYASTELLYQEVGFKQRSIEGLQKFADWYVGYYGVGGPLYLVGDGFFGNFFLVGEFIDFVFIM